MDCDRIREQLADAALGRELPSDATHHVANCRACAVELDQLKATLALVDREVDAGLAAKVPPDLVARVRENIGETAPARWPMHAWAGALVVGLALAVLSAKFIAPPTPPSKTVQVESEVAEPTPSEIPGEPPPKAAIPPPTVVELLEVSRPTPTTVPQPDVLVIPGQQDAMVDYFRQMRLRESDATLLGVEGSLENLTEAPAVEIAAIQLAPVRLSGIEIEPIDLNERR